MTYADLLNKLIEENKRLALENEDLKRQLDKAKESAQATTPETDS